MRKLTSSEITDAFRIIRKKYPAGYPLGIKKPRKISYNLVRIAHHWLDAQVIDDSDGNYSPRYDIKDRIGEWCGLQVPAFYIILAAELCSGVKGEYPAYNISNTVVNPSLSRLDGLHLDDTYKKVFKFKGN